MIESRCKTSKHTQPAQSKNNRKLKSILNPAHTKSYSKQVCTQKPNINLRNSHTKSKIQNIIEKSVPIQKQGKRHTQSVLNINSRKQSSLITKRRKQSKLDNKFNNKIKGKTEAFKVIAKCLKQYVKQQSQNNKKPDYDTILKFMKAFNKSEIRTVSKPLEKLITEILDTMQSIFPKQDRSESPDNIKETVYVKETSHQKKKHSFDNFSDKEDATVKKRTHYRQTTEPAFEKEPQFCLETDLHRMSEQLFQLKAEQQKLRQFQNALLLEREMNSLQRLKQVEKLQKIVESQQLQIKSLHRDQQALFY